MRTPAGGNRARTDRRRDDAAIQGTARSGNPAIHETKQAARNAGITKLKKRATATKRVR